jgi:tetratricopeptide (TPR) repeat protein
MKTLTFIILTLTATVLFGQNKTDSLKLEIDTLFKQNRPLEALAIMEGLISQKDTIIGYARYKTRIGLIYQSLDSTDRARLWYLDVMNDPLISDTVEDYWLGEWEVRGNYKHVSCYQIAVSYYKQEDYNNSIKYYQLALDSFPYYHFSGSDINKNRVKISNNIADLYIKQGDLTKAFSYLIPFFGDPTIYSDRAGNKAARIIRENGLKEDFLALMKKITTN